MNFFQVCMDERYECVNVHKCKFTSVWYSVAMVTTFWWNLYNIGQLNKKLYFKNVFNVFYKFLYIIFDVSITHALREGRILKWILQRKTNNKQTMALTWICFWNKLFINTCWIPCIWVLLCTKWQRAPGKSEAYYTDHRLCWIVL